MAPKKKKADDEKATRDDFSDKTKRLICDRSAARCANPNCRRIARFTGSTNRIINFGDAAHIVAASVDGPRGREAGEEEIKSEANAIWLCATCHRIVDRDAGAYSDERLRLWKRISESEFAYEPITPAISLPGRLKTVGNTATEEGAIRNATIGLHLLVGQSKDLRAVCSKVTIEIMSEFGHGELRAKRFYDDEVPGNPKTKEDWHSFMFTDGLSANVYFENHHVPWLRHDPLLRNEGVVLLRSKVYGRLAADELEPFVSPWVVGIVNLERIEYDEFNSYQHLVKSADLILKLFRSPVAAHIEFAKRMLANQRYRPGFEQIVVESTGNLYIEGEPLLTADAQLVVLEPLNLGLESINCVWNGNSYILKHSFSHDPSSDVTIDRTDLHGMWNGPEGQYVLSRRIAAQRWVRDGRFTERVLTDGKARPIVFGSPRPFNQL